MEIVLIAALTSARVIGAGGRIPWHHAPDMRHFRRATTGHPVVMGRTTYESLPSRPLARRTNIVLSRQARLPLEPGVIHCRSLDQALEWCRRAGRERVYVAGGAEVYRHALPAATGMILTQVPDDVAGDAFFPEWRAIDWDIVGSREEGDVTIVTYQRTVPHGPANAGERSMFERLQMAPPDPILGLTAAFNQDPNPAKINLGVGVYKDDRGATPIFAAVKRAEERVLTRETSKSYLPIDGPPEFARAVQELLLGADSPVIGDQRAVTLQTPGGTGGLRLAGDLVHQQYPQATIWLSEPTWANHPKIFSAAGLRVQTYPYYDSDTSGLAFARMRETILQIPAGDVLLLHGCCHNPTGVDPTLAQWRELADVVRARGVLPLVDFAYQGLGDGLREDARGLERLCGTDTELLIASSYSKSFGLYNERVGALTLIAANADAARVALSHAKIAARSNYSNPPAHGSAVVTEVLTDPELRQDWERELDAMRDRIHAMRQLLVDTLKAKGVTRDFHFITSQQGMFSFSGLAPEQVQRLRDEYAIYIVGSGRINVAGLTSENMGTLATAVAAVLGSRHPAPY